MKANSLPPDIGRRLRSMEEALYNLQRERTLPPSTLDNCPTGMVAGFLSANPPQGWMLLNGQTVTEAGEPRLYAYLVANGFSTTLPDYRDRFPVGAGNLYSHTSTGGSADAAVVTHSHTLPVKYTFTGSHVHAGVGGGVAENPDPTDGDSFPTISTGAAGSSGTNANLPPYRGLYWMIRT